ncbi:hypothetical protein KGQ20_14545 [Catenulispora sp. NF23]|uniref:MmyB family transcriptional regulator n=1 Tax=Catenulispora pinistramenti TaxID=2705254 RepID=UPI001BA54DEE|nr:hypothetical protein [Catenulispora pinistramenti]MBS2533991.1 hypothetical protein [Catenulispora pinistramenti]
MCTPCLQPGTGRRLRPDPRDPHNRALTELVGELSTQSGLFRTRWAAHDVLLHHGGVKQIHHPVVGELTLGYDALELPADTGLTIMAYSAEPATPTRDALDLPASWAATVDRDSGSDSRTHPAPPPRPGAPA